MGDPDGDGLVTFTDISALSLFLVGNGTIDAEYAPNADYDGDGEVTFLDLTAMYIALIG